MATKIDFNAVNKPEPEMSEGNKGEVSRMQECISMIESGEGEKAIPILQQLISGEATESEQEEPQEQAPKSFREEMASKI